MMLFFKVIYRINGDHKSIGVDIAKEDTVEDVMRKIEEQHNYYYENQTVIIQGRVVGDMVKSSNEDLNKNFWDYQPQYLATIHLIVSERQYAPSLTK